MARRVAMPGTTGGIRGCLARFRVNIGIAARSGKNDVVVSGVEAAGVETPGVELSEAQAFEQVVDLLLVSHHIGLAGRVDLRAIQEAAVARRFMRRKVDQ